MTDALFELLAGPLGAFAAAAVAAMAWLVDRTRQRRKGEREGRANADKEARMLDHENAAAIRRRARDADGVHSADDTRGHRD